MILRGWKPFTIGYKWCEVATKDLRAIQTADVSGRFKTIDSFALDAL